MSADSDSDSESYQHHIHLRHKALDPFRTFWNGIEPFDGGKSTVPPYQTSLYYTCAGPEGDVHRRIDFSKVGTDDLAALYEACKPAAFGRNGETVLDDTYRKARKMDPDAFATLFDPRSVGILERVSRGLLTGTRGSGITEMELHKLNVYGKGDFFKPHQDTPRNQNMVGSLVVVLPTRHEGGQLVLRQGTQAWTLDFADTFATATEPLVCFVAFFGDVEHEVLPITSGYRVTFTYNLYRKQSHPSTSCIPTPFHERFKKALVELINDESTLPGGGYLGCGLVHEYVYSEDKPINGLLDQLKGVDQILAMICEELGLRCSLTLLYRNLCEDSASVNLIARSKHALRSSGDGKWCQAAFLEDALARSTIEDVEGVEIIGHPFNREVLEYEDLELSFLLPLYKDPVTKILEIRPMSSVEMATPWAYYGNEASLEYVYGHACMLIAVDPVATRKKHVL